MSLPPVNYLAVLVSGIVIFILGGLWYSPVLFAKPWIRLMGKTEEELKSGGGGVMAYVLVFLCGLVSAWVLAVIMNHFKPPTPVRGAALGALCWLGFAGPSSFATALFSMQPRGLWAINSLYNLASFVIAGVILAVWRY